QAKSPGHAADLVFARLNAEAHEVEGIGQRAHLVKRNGLEISGLYVDVVADRVVESPGRSAGRSAGWHRLVGPKPDTDGVSELAPPTSDEPRFKRCYFSAI